MTTLEERLATLEESNRTIHDDMREIKLLLEGVRPFQIQQAQVVEWQNKINASITALMTVGERNRADIIDLKLWRSYLLGGMTVVVFLLSSGIMTALFGYFMS